MAKQSRAISAVQQGKLVRHEETIDDNLLPTSEELKKLQSNRPDLIDIVVRFAEKEQDSRHNIRIEEINAFKNQSIKDFAINYTGLIFAFFVMIAGMYFSTVMINNGNNVIGTVFAGATLLVGVAIFINPLKKNKSQS